MDSDQFNALVSRLSTHLTRRRSLGLFSVAALSGAGLADDADARKKKKKRNKKPPPAPPPTTKPPGCQCDQCKQETCQAGVCACPGGMTRDANGFCGTTFTCLPAGSTTPNPAACCSGTSTPTPGTPGSVTCMPGTTTCQSAADCIGGGKCRGFKCPPLYVATVGQQCAARSAERPTGKTRRQRRRG